MDKESPKPRTKRELYGSDNPFSPDIPSEFVGVDPGPGLVRQENGKVAFGEGNKFSKGYPHRTIRNSAHAEVMYWLEEHRDAPAKMIAKLYELGNCGNIEAIKEFLNRTLGKVTDRVEVEGMDSSGWSFTIKVREPSQDVAPDPLPDILEVPLPPPTENDRAI